jgi:hypothetical protein
VGDTLRETRCVKPPEGGARLFFRPDPTGPRGPRDPRPPVPRPVGLWCIRLRCAFLRVGRDPFGRCFDHDTMRHDVGNVGVAHLV